MSFCHKTLRMQLRLVITPIMTDEQLLHAVSAWNQSWDVISWDWLKRCEMNMKRYFCLDDDQRDGLRAIIKEQQIDAMEYV